MTKTILILAANPKDTSRLRLDQEIREIANGLQRAQRRDEFILEQVWAVRLKDFRRSMLDLKPDIVHFCGHGSMEEGLVLEDQGGHSKFMPASALAGFFKLFAGIVECVVLNACYSEVQAAAIAEHVPYVIGMRKDIGDDAAIEFAVAFYDALGAGGDVKFAHKLACNAIQMAGLSENLIPALKSKPKFTEKTIPVSSSNSFAEAVQRDYQAELISQNIYEIEVAPGEVFTLKVVWKNTGKKAFPKQVRMGTLKPRDHISQFYMDDIEGWVSLNRVEFNTSVVRPGEIATFEIPMGAPPSPGIYKECFGLVYDRYRWLRECPIVCVNITVTE
jgi:hypothetical protein